MYKRQLLHLRNPHGEIPDADPGQQFLPPGEPEASTILAMASPPGGAEAAGRDVRHLQETVLLLEQLRQLLELSLIHI